MKQILMFPQYPYRPGWKKRDTSKNAADDIKSHAETLRSQALATIIAMPRTADEVALAMNEQIWSIRPRISELARQGLIKDSGIRRKNDSGKSAIVWKLI